MAEIDPISSFSSNPLTTTFSRPDDCSGIQRSSFISGVDIATSCMPDGFEPDPSSFFSPGLICPDGYVSACHENTGVESITTVTCCPKVEDVTLSCVTAKTLQSVWTDYFCTWIGPEKETSMPITLSDNGKTSTEMVGYKSPGGLNAYGVRMVYQSSDLEEAEITAPPDNGEEDPEPVSDGDGGGLSTGAKAAIGVVVPVVVIAIAVAVFFFMRRRKKAAAAALAPAEADSKPPPVYGDAPMAHPQPPAELPIAQEPHPTELHAGSLKAPAKSWPLEPKSSTHGFQFWDIQGEQLLYTADMGTDSIWTHAVDQLGGVREVGRITLSRTEVKPRFLEIHPNRQYMYMVLEYDNSITAFPMDEAGEVCENEDGVWPLVPDEADGEHYWSAVLAISPDKKHLWATTRGKNGNVGYISGFKLNKQGAIVERMFRVLTNSTGTTTSSLTVAPWSNEHVIYGDAPGGFLAVLKLVPNCEAGGFDCRGRG